VFAGVLGGGGAPLAGAILLDQNDATWYVVLGVPLTLIAGALLDRWWAALVPWVLTAILLAVWYVTDPTCSDCAEESDRGLQVFITVILFAVPATVAMAIGVLARRVTRHFGKLQSG
jgi:hypothetical protein